MENPVGFPIHHILLAAQVPAGYAFGINENDPVAVGQGVPRCSTAKLHRLEYIKVPWGLGSGSATCWVVKTADFHNHSGRIMAD